MGRVLTLNMFALGNNYIFEILVALWYTFATLFRLLFSRSCSVFKYGREMRKWGPILTQLSRELCKNLGESNQNTKLE